MQCESSGEKKHVFQLFALIRESLAALSSAADLIYRVLRAVHCVKVDLVVLPIL